MANLKIIDAEQLNADLTLVADAIRAKAGIEDQLAFPQGFAETVGAMKLADTERMDALDLRLTDSLVSYSSEAEGNGANCAFRACESLETIELSRITTVGSYMFQTCYNLRSARFPMAATVYMGAFASCYKLADIYIPNATVLFAQACTGCSSLERLDCPKVETLYTKVFFNCSSLQVLILRHSSVVSLANTDAFTGTPMEEGTGYIYVPGDLLESYKSANNWSTYASQFRAIEDYPEICGGGSA